MNRWSHRGAAASGQATVEHVAIVVVVALALAAAGAWLTSHVHPDRAPPPVITHVWSGLDRITEPAPGLPDLGLVPRGRGGRPIGQFVRRIGRGLRTAHRLVAVGSEAFTSGVGHGLVGAVTDVVRDPTTLLTDGSGFVTDLARDPTGLVAAQLDAAIEYAKHLRALPPDEAYRTFMRDLGEASVEVAILRGKRLAKAAILRALKRRLDERGVSKPPPRDDKRDGN